MLIYLSLITVARVAKVCGISPTSPFRSYTDDTALEWVACIHILVVLRLTVRRSNLKIADRP